MVINIYQIQYQFYRGCFVDLQLNRCLYIESNIIEKMNDLSSVDVIIFLLELVISIIQS